LQEKSSIRELIAEEHQMAKQDLQYRLKLAEHEQSERLKAVISRFITSLFVVQTDHIVMFCCY